MLTFTRVTCFFFFTNLRHRWSPMASMSLNVLNKTFEPEWMTVASNIEETSSSSAIVCICIDIAWNERLVPSGGKALVFWRRKDLEAQRSTAK